MAAMPKIFDRKEKIKVLRGHDKLLSYDSKDMTCRQTSHSLSRLLDQVSLNILFVARHKEFFTQEEFDPENELQIVWSYRRCEEIRNNIERLHIWREKMRQVGPETQMKRIK